MPYYCKKCKKSHPGWPDFTLKYPEEYLRLTEKERKKKVVITEQGIEIKHDNHVHVYRQAHLELPIKKSQHRWLFKVWVMTKPSYNLAFLKKTKDYMQYGVKMQNNLPMYVQPIIGYPMIVAEKKGSDFLSVESVRPDTNAFANDFIYGMPLDIAQYHADDLLDNVDWSCNGSGIILKK